jgi:hypothetical protein
VQTSRQRWPHAQTNVAARVRRALPCVCGQIDTTSTKIAGNATSTLEGPLRHASTSRPLQPRAPQLFSSRKIVLASDLSSRFMPMFMFMLHASCSSCFMFHASCFMLHASCFMLHVPCFHAFMLHAL